MRAKPYQTPQHILAGQNVAVRPSEISRAVLSGALCGAIFASSIFGTFQARRAFQESFRRDSQAIEEDLATAGRWAGPAQVRLETAVDPGRCILYAPDHSRFPAGMSSLYLAPGCTPAETAREWNRL